MNWRPPIPPPGKRLKMDADSPDNDDDGEDEDFVVLSSDETNLIDSENPADCDGPTVSVSDNNQNINSTETEEINDLDDNVDDHMTDNDEDRREDGDEDHESDGSSSDQSSSVSDSSSSSSSSSSGSRSTNHEYNEYRRRARDAQPSGSSSDDSNSDLIFFDVDEESDERVNFDRSDIEDGTEALAPEEYLKYDPTPETQYPKPDWITLNELRQRRVGLFQAKQIGKPTNIYWFERYANNSLWMIQRLELSQRLEGHCGCVNSLDFNSNGKLLCSGSDDLSVSIWDWQTNRLKKRIETGHLNNVFHSQFCNSDENIITASRDGSVRLIDVETGRSELLMRQSGEIGKLAFITPDTIVTCGTNASVNLIDLRIRDPTKLFIVRNPRNNRSCELHTINAHPIDKHKIVVAGASPYVFLYDLRRARDHNDQQHKPQYVLDKFKKTNNIVTSTAFNSIGDKLLVSYNDDDLFVCKTETWEVIHRYTGHRNQKTIKNCSWFGDNFVLSGSDDGHIYGWDLQSEHIVCFLDADRKGVVNCLCVHPNIPVLASSGLDHDVKVWEPTSSIWPQTLKGIKFHICKNTIKRKRSKNFRSRLFRSSNFDDEVDSESDTDVVVAF